MLNFRTCRAAFGAALFAGFLAAFAVPAQSADWPRSDVPPDPAMTFGVLANGMRYAIMHNSTPSGEVSVRLRTIGTGSMQESPPPLRQGLAHFLRNIWRFAVRPFAL